MSGPEERIYTAEMACSDLGVGLAGEIEAMLSAASWLPIDFVVQEGGCIHALVQDLAGSTRSVTITVAVEDWLPDCGTGDHWL